MCGLAPCPRNIARPKVRGGQLLASVAHSELQGHLFPIAPKARQTLAAHDCVPPVPAIKLTSAFDQLR